MKSINPATGKLIAEYPEHTTKEIEQIIAVADKTFDSWKTTTFAQRRKLMKEAARVLRAEVETYAELMSLEMGKIISESRAEVEKCAWVCDYYADNAENFLADEIIETDASKRDRKRVV